MICKIMICDFMGVDISDSKNIDGLPYDRHNIIAGIDYCNWLLDDLKIGIEPHYGFKIIAFKKWLTKKLRLTTNL